MPRSVTIWSGVVLAAACASAVVAAEPMGRGPGAPPPPGAGAEPPDMPAPPSAEERAAKLKAILQLSASQDAAVAEFVSATAPPDPEDLPLADRQALEQMTTPQRLDQMAKMQAEAGARIARAADATRAFYAALTPSQKAAFDALPPPAVMGFAGPAGHPAPMRRLMIRP
ncbi:MAG: Spy/CpxP family protein refolding chaperone [Phenylobacterium sp.]|uniref:Spy/CpxP family protein refolding chaperone n=1 Tax=Phenylobacterium sp. TaxID=1871053 RepID=UPI003918FFE7